MQAILYLPYHTPAMSLKTVFTVINVESTSVELSMHFLATVCCRTVVCPVCLSVTMVYCGQTVQWINMKLGMEADLGPGHIVLDGDPSFSPKGHCTPILWPMSTVAKRLDGSRYHLVGKQTLAQGTLYISNLTIFISILPTFQTLSFSRIPPSLKQTSSEQWVRGKIVRSVLCNICATIVHGAMYTYIYTYQQTQQFSGLGFVSLGPFHCTQIHFCIVYYCVSHACVQVCNTVKWTWWE